MPKLGFDMQEGTLIRWVKAEGEEVNKGDVLAEIETDKATVEVESSFSGVVARHLVPQGEIVPVGTPIAVIGAPGEEVPADAGAPAAPEGERKSPSEEKPEPVRAQDIASAEKAGDENPPHIEGKQAAAETIGQAATAPAAQQTEKEQAQAAEKPVGEIAPAETKTETGGDGRIKASPLARKVASENGVDLRQVKGSGPDGRIVRSDVEAALAAPKQATATPVAPATPVVPAAPSGAPAAPVAPAEKRGPALVPLAPISTGAFQVPADERIKINRLRQAIGRRMVESKQQVPHFYVTRAYKMEKVMELRKQLNAYVPDDQKLTVNDFVLKAVALNLRQFPGINAAIQGDEIVRFGRVNVGVAVAIEGGLMTIVVKDADQKSLRQISIEVREMANRARSGKVRTEDIEGSTFSISNLGMFDVDDFLAIINPPESAILSISSAKEVPVVENGEIKVGLRMNATISADHRVTDGAEAARFMQNLAAYLEEPMRLML
jgi:pyruvate dehydrogenase E2 component (dihydrolipoamide acetyltransferase)